MNIADIDLDIFQDDVCSIDRWPRSPSTTRPWNEAQLRVFLEDQCGLKRDPIAQRPKGWYVVHHDEAFPILVALSKNGAVPITLTHIDAHSDLGTGLGDLSWMEIGGRLLGLAPSERAAAVPQNGMERISPANYLSYALACRWLSSLTYVHHAQSGDDLMPFFFWEFDTTSGVLQLRYVPRVRDASSKEQLRALPHALEPQIPFQKVSIEDYRADKPFDYVILCQSPGYTSVKADALIPIFRDYIDLDRVDCQGFPYLSVHPSGKGGTR